jgi:Fe-S-cluster-containing dehydrogenase component
MDHEHSEPLTFYRDASPALTRRRAMGLMAASLALAGSGCSRPPTERIYPWVQMPEARAEGAPLYYASAMVRDGHALGVLVGTQQGRPIKIEGNPLHPSSNGATDVFAQASVLELWDPDRSNVVMQRLAGGERRDASAPSSWQAFEAQWRRVAPSLAAQQGEGLRLLTGPVSSPTLRAQLAALLQRYPRARWHQQTPPHEEAARRGAVLTFGRPVQTVLHPQRAACIVALASDPFSDGPGAVRFAAEWSQQRRNADAAALYAAEATPGLFGARADRRVALPPERIDRLIARVAAQLLDGAAPGGPAEGLAAFEAELIAALRAAGPATLIVPGASLSPASHALVHAIHERLGATNRTIDAIEPLAIAPDAATIEALAQEMHAGAVRALFVLDGNPVYDTPGALAFAAALAKVPFSVHCGLYRDETALACAWHLPLSHDYERWSDALAHDGTACIVQPAIAPLYDSRSLHEVVALMAADDVRDGYRLVQRQWRARGGADFDALWRESLRRGAIEGTAATPLRLPPARVTAAAPEPVTASAQDGMLSAIFAPDPSVHDGRFANIGWLQELPRPFTKLTWDNAATIGPGTAKSIGLATGDIVRIEAAGRRIDAPVWVLAAHAEDAVTLPLGYGRSHAGRVGNGVGFDAYALLPVAGQAALRVSLRALGRRHDFAITQHFMDPSGREPARVVAPGERAEADLTHPSLYPDFPSTEHAWAMSIDLDACIGCNACTIACQAENNIPVVGKEEVARGRAMHWIRVDRYESEKVAGSLFQPVPCMHCEKAPCELVCPVGATMHDSEGLNVQVYNRCIGTRFCSNNCPYKVRRFNFLQYSDETTETLKGQKNPNVTVRQRGVMEKCTYCLQRVARARQHAEATGTPLADGDVVTACQAVCPTSAIQFGDLNDRQSLVARLRQSPRHYALLGELDTRPRTTYLARVQRKERKA